MLRSLGVARRLAGRAALEACDVLGHQQAVDRGGREAGGDERCRGDPREVDLGVAGGH